MKNILILICTITLLNSCTKIIEVDLNKVAPKIVVNANISNAKGKNMIVLSKTTSFFNVSEVNRLSNAKIEVTDENGEKFTFIEKEKGIYKNPDLNVEVNKKYNLNIEYEGVKLSASSTSPEIIKIDSIVTQELNLPRFGRKSNSNSIDNGIYTINVYFKDIPNKDNYYYLNLFVNDTIIRPHNNIINDYYFGGNKMYISSEPLPLKGNEKIRAELSAISEATYKYYFTLNRLDRNGIGSATPGNPPSNIEGDAIGVFNVNTLDTKTIMFSPDK